MIILSGRQRGVILFFSLWVLIFLAVLAVSLAAGIRQKITLVKRLDERSRMNYVTQAGVKKACAYARAQLEASGFQYTPDVKIKLHNNPSVFASTPLGADEVEVGFTSIDNDGYPLRFGMVDEERKININRVSRPVLTELIVRVLSMKEEAARQLASAILDWRQYGDSQQQGFFSDDYYANLQYPYRKKNADYESIDELLLVKGIDKRIYERLRFFVTVYGEGQVNINTTPAEVLSALGLDEALIVKILEVRRGNDGIEATEDDHIFVKAFDVAVEIHAQVKLDPMQMRSIDALNMQGLLTTGSSYFAIESLGRLAHRDASHKTRAIYALRENKILYWKEK